MKIKISVFVLLVVLCLFIQPAGSREMLWSGKSDVYVGPEEGFRSATVGVINDTRTRIIIICEKEDIENLRIAALTIITYGKLWGINQGQIEDFTKAYNSTQHYEEY